MTELLIRVASAAVEDGEFTRAELVNQAREFGLLEPLVGVKDDPAPDATMSKRWGRALQRYRGQLFKDRKGRTFQFASRHTKSGSVYPLKFLP